MSWMSEISLEYSDRFTEEELTILESLPEDIRIKLNILVKDLMDVRTQYKLLCIMVDRINDCIAFNKEN